MPCNLWVNVGRRTERGGIGSLLDMASAQNAPQEKDFDGKTLGQVIQDVERQYICAVLNATDGNKMQAAKMAGLTYQTFIRKLNALNLKMIYHAG